MGGGAGEAASSRGDGGQVRPPALPPAWAADAPWTPAGAAASRFPTADSRCWAVLPLNRACRSLVVVAYMVCSKTNVYVSMLLLPGSAGGPATRGENKEAAAFRSDQRSLHAPGLPRNATRSQEAGSWCIQCKLLPAAMLVHLVHLGGTHFSSSTWHEMGGSVCACHAHADKQAPADTLPAGSDCCAWLAHASAEDQVPSTWRSQGRRRQATTLGAGGTAQSTPCVTPSADTTPPGSSARQTKSSDDSRVNPWC
jgi:hypothetical protein